MIEPVGLYDRDYMRSTRSERRRRYRGSIRPGGEGALALAVIVSLLVALALWKLGLTPTITLQR